MNKEKKHSHSAQMTQDVSFGPFLMVLRWWEQLWSVCMVEVVRWSLWATVELVTWHTNDIHMRCVRLQYNFFYLLKVQEKLHDELELKYHHLLCMDGNNSHS